MAALVFWAGCGDGDAISTTDASEPDKTEPDAGMDADVEVDDAGRDGGLDAASQLDAASESDPAVIERGRYLTTNVYPCGNCHTSRTDPTKLFAGVDCWTDTLPMDPNMGCLSSSNLTNHETGIKDDATSVVMDLILKGERSDGKYLHPQMPYALLGNIRESDAFAIVAYLRSLPPIDHMVKANQPPFDVRPSSPAERWPETLIPMPRADYADQAAALRGRYLAGNFGGCMDCHTPRGTDNASIREKAFQGGRRFTNASIPDPYYSPNLTPDATGLADWTLDDIVRAIKRGEDKDQGYSKLCPPMPSGPMGAYGGLTDDDARDIAHYLLSLPPVENHIMGDCQLPPDGGLPDGGAGDAGVGDGGADATTH